MSIKSRLLASALIPVMAGWFGTYPAGAANVSTAAEFAQAEPSAPGEDRLPKPEARDSVEESGGEDARPRRRAEDAEPAARAPREAPARAGDEGGRPERPRRERQDAGQPPREAPPRAEDDGGQPERPRRPREDAGQADETRPTAPPPREAPPQAGDDGGRPDEARPSGRPQRENPVQTGDDAGPPPAEPDAGRAQDGQPPAQPRPDAERQTGNDGQRPPESRPSEAGRPDEAPRAERPEPPAPPIEDPRTERELKEEAADPSRTDDTVVLPVDNGAAVLDSDKDADNRGGQSAREERRRERERQRRQEADQPPRDDAEAQRRAPPVRQADIEAGNREEGRRRDHAPDFFRELLAPLVQGGQRGPDAPRRVEDRAVYETDGGIVVRSDERRRLRRDAEETYYEDLARGRVRETIVRPDGLRIVTIYDRYGDVIQRTRVAPDGREHLLVYAPDADSERRPPVFRDPGEDLPPMRLRIPVRDYIVDTSSDPDRDYYEFLSEPPVEQVERVYTVDEVKYSARLRDKVRRIDLDTITFVNRRRNGTPYRLPKGTPASGCIGSARVGPELSI